MSQDCNVLRIRIHHNVRVMSYDDHLPARLNPLECRDYQIIDKFVIQIIFRLVKKERIIAELEDNCKQCGGLLPRRALINFTKAALTLLLIPNSKMIFGEPEIDLSFESMWVQGA